MAPAPAPAPPSYQPAWPPCPCLSPSITTIAQGSGLQHQHQANITQVEIARKSGLDNHWETQKYIIIFLSLEYAYQVETKNLNKYLVKS